MLNDNLPSLIFIRVAITILRLVGPCACAYTIFWIWSATSGLNGSHSPWLRGIQVYVAVEAAFYVVLLSYTRWYIQREAVHPPLRTPADREAVFTKIYSELHDTERFLSGWFKGAKFEGIGHDDLKSFLDWVFWEGRATAKDDKEVEGYIQKIEDVIGKKFKPGKGSARGLRLTLDPIEVASRPLAWYFLLMAVETGDFLRLKYHGFAYYRTGFLEPLVFPPRPGLLLGQQSPSRKLSYWYRPHTSKTRPPVLFIHGIGIGMHPHIGFLYELDRQLNGTQDHSSDGTVGIIALEILPISSRITNPILRRSDFIAHITNVLDFHQIDKFVLCSHSYGSVFSTYVLTYEPLASRVAATVLLDPVTILLHMPDVAFNFTVRRPARSASQWQLWYFASKDPGVAHTLGRHFFWFENCLWRDHIVKLVDEGMRITVSLASEDLIVDTTAVAKYLLQDEIPDPVVYRDDGQERMRLEGNEHEEDDDNANGKSEPWKTRPWRGQGLDVLWWEGLNHAQVFDYREPTVRLAQIIAQYCLR